MFLSFKNFVDKINEGLIKTYDIDFTIKSMIDELSTLNLDITFTKNNNTFDTYKINNVKKKLPGIVC